MQTYSLHPLDYLPWVRKALEEDIGTGDATTLATIPANLQGSVLMNAREEMIACGLPLAQAAFLTLDPTLQITILASEGQLAPPGTPLMKIEGAMRPILSGERVALNYVQWLSGIATETHRLVEQTRHTKAKILDTRKTKPNQRRLEKYAVATGGGQNHRFGLYDLIMIKDNHLAALRQTTSNPFLAAVTAARNAYPSLKVELEVDTVDQALLALEAQPDILMLDNMSPEDMIKIVQLPRPQTLLEASGNVRLETIRPIAETGVDFISVGAITHSARARDIGLDYGT